MAFRFIVSVMFLFAGPACLQARTLPFTLYSVEDGLPQSSILSMLQDKTGFLWFGTQNGLCRYDGFIFRPYSREDGMTEQRVFALLQDRNGQIWAGAQTDGLFRFDGRNWRGVSLDGGRAAVTVNALLEDSRGLIWIGHSGGLSRFDGRRATRLDGRDGVPEGRVSALVQDRSGRIWASFPGRGVWWTDGGLWRQETAAGLSGASVTAMVQDHAGRIWFGTRGQGLACFDGTAWRRYTTADGAVSETILALMVDRDGRLWAGSPDAGAGSFDGRRWQVYSQVEGLSNNQVESILQDREGNIWIGTMGGANKLVSTKFVSYSTQDGLPDNTVWAIQEDARGRIWVGLNSGGVARFENNVWQVDGSLPWMWNTPVRVIHRDRNQHLWFGTTSGVARFDGTKWFQYRHELGEAGSTVYDIAEDRSGRLWFGTLLGLARFDGKDWTVAALPPELPSRMVNDLFVDSRDRLWVATQAGAGCLDGENWKVYTVAHGLPHERVMSITEDAAGHMWFATFGGGICRWDGRRFTTFTRREGLSNNFCYFIYSDHPWLYIGTNFGLNRFDGRQFRPYTSRDGLISSEMNQGAIHKDRDGRLWIGTVRGVTRFDPAQDLPNRVPPLIIVSGMHLFDRPLPVRSGQRFSYKDNYFRFDFLGLHLTDPKSLTYRYRLLGISDDWSETEARTISFPYLPPGDYAFEVKARNRDGVWSISTARLDFAVAPPFWLDWWFQTLAALLILGLLYLIRWLELRNLRRQSRLLKQLVAARTQELEIKAQELEESNLRLKELDRLKSNFLSTVSHELRTPLTSIRAYSELLMDNPGEEPDTRRRFTTIINAESERLTRLIDDLLDLSRIESGRFPWAMRRLSLRDIVDRAVQNAASLGRIQDLEILAELPDELPEVCGDADRLLQVMTNLLGNAIKFTPPGGVIRVGGAIRPDPPPGAVEICVSDTGPGIAPEHREKIFQKFYQADSTLTREKGGSGLGLAISEEILRGHGGRIWVESVTGRGSRFIFSLPVAAEVPAEDCPVPG